MKKLLTVLVLLIVMVSAVAPTLAASQDDTRAFLFPQRRGDNVLIELHRVNVTIDNQVATTRIEQVFANDSSSVAEGTYIFPLPIGAAVSNLIMWVNGEPIEAKILDADEARNIYDEIVRRMRDPALLEYVGMGAIQASVFPIQPFSEIKIEIEYSQLLQADNGLVHYEYPLRTDQFTRRPVESMSINVSVVSNDPISTIYSPTHNIAVSRDGDYKFRAGYEESFARSGDSFSLFYGLVSDEINVNLLTYRESARDDGFFTLMITPPFEVEEQRAIPKDVIVVLDQSGSMHGEKWEQARQAVKYVLDSLHERDRFNVIVFSTGHRVFANELLPASQANEARRWVEGLDAIGGTDINLALTEAVKMADPDRAAVILFLTDGLATEGTVDTDEILENVRDIAPSNARIFTFGVGDDVDTFLLDQLHQSFRGAGTYVRPHERIDEEVSALYNKISAPVLTNIALDFGGILVEDMYPSGQLPDLFAGSQLIVVGRYRDSGRTTITLRGELDGKQQEFRYPVEFAEYAGGQEFIPRLWATRKIGALLNSIRLHGEDPELVDSIVRLSIRYGIITPYTSFLITEDDIFSQSGREEAQTFFEGQTNQAFGAVSGEGAIQAAESMADMAEAAAPMAAPTMMARDREEKDETTMTAPGSAASGGQAMRYVGDRTFVWRNDTWMDTLYDADTMQPETITFLSDAYFDLLDLDSQIGEFLALGEHVLFVWEGQAYEVVPQ